MSTTTTTTTTTTITSVSMIRWSAVIQRPKEYSRRSWHTVRPWDREVRRYGTFERYGMHHALLGVRRLISSRPVIKCGYSFLAFINPANVLPTKPNPHSQCTRVINRVFRKIASGRKSKVTFDWSDEALLGHGPGYGAKRLLCNAKFAVAR